MKNPQEWLRQADYDLDSAEYMFQCERYIYCIFLCHLAIEKAMKGLYTIRLNSVPPKTHNLIYLIEKMNLSLPVELYDFIFILNRVSVPTRYPDDFQKLIKEFETNRTKEILENSKKVLKWLKENLQK